MRSSRSANIRGEKAAWSLDTSPHVGPVRDAVRNWVCGAAPAPGLLLHGSPGTGKTGLVVGILREIVGSGLGDPGRWDYCNTERVLQRAERNGEFPPFAPVWYEWWPSLLRRFAESVKEDDPDGESRFSFSQLQREMARHVRVLALDDFDIPSATPFREEVMVWVLDEFLGGGKRLIVTTNRAEPEELLASIGERATSRLLGSSFVRVHTGTRDMR